MNPNNFKGYLPTYLATYLSICLSIYLHNSASQTKFLPSRIRLDKENKSAICKSQGLQLWSKRNCWKVLLSSRSCLVNLFPFSAYIALRTYCTVPFFFSYLGYCLFTGWSFFWKEAEGCTRQRKFFRRHSSAKDFLLPSRSVCWRWEDCSDPPRRPIPGKVY